MNACAECKFSATCLSMGFVNFTAYMVTSWMRAGTIQVDVRGTDHETINKAYERKYNELLQQLKNQVSPACPGRKSLSEARMRVNENLTMLPEVTLEIAPPFPLKKIGVTLKLEDE